MAYGERWNNNSYPPFSSNFMYEITTNIVLPAQSSLIASPMNRVSDPSHYPMPSNALDVGQELFSNFAEMSREESSINGRTHQLPHHHLPNGSVWNQIPSSQSQRFPLQRFSEIQESHMPSFQRSHNYPNSYGYCNPFMRQYFERGEQMIHGSSSSIQNRNNLEPVPNIQPQKNQMSVSNSMDYHSVTNEYFQPITSQFPLDETDFIPPLYPPMINKIQNSENQHLHSLSKQVDNVCQDHHQISQQHLFPCQKSRSGLSESDRKIMIKDSPAQQHDRNSNGDGRDPNLNTHQFFQHNSFVCEKYKNDNDGSDGKSKFEISIDSSTNLSENALAQQIGRNSKRDHRGTKVNAHQQSQQNSITCQSPVEGERKNAIKCERIIDSSCNFSGNALSQLGRNGNVDGRNSNLKTHSASQLNSFTCQNSGRSSVDGDEKTTIKRSMDSSFKLSENESNSNEDSNLSPHGNIKSNMDTSRRKYLLKINIIVIGLDPRGPIDLIKTFARHENIIPSTTLKMVFQKEVLNCGVSNEVQVWYLKNILGYVQKTLHYLCTSYKSVIMAVYDIQKPESFHHIQLQIRTLKNIFGNAVPIILVGNNTTGEIRTVLNQSNARELELIPYRLGLQARTYYQLSLFLECSVKSSEDVDALVSHAINFASTCNI